MIRLTSAAAAALLCWFASAAAQTVPATAGPVPAAVIEELVLASPATPPAPGTCGKRT
jgi:hypothetical protein